MAEIGWHNVTYRENALRRCCLFQIWDFLLMLAYVIYELLVFDNYAQRMKWTTGNWKVN